MDLPAEGDGWVRVRVTLTVGMLLSILWILSTSSALESSRKGTTTSTSPSLLRSLKMYLSPYGTNSSLGSFNSNVSPSMSSYLTYLAESPLMYDETLCPFSFLLPDVLVFDGYGSGDDMLILHLSGRG